MSRATTSASEVPSAWATPAPATTSTPAVTVVISACALIFNFYPHIVSDALRQLELGSHIGASTSTGRWRTHHTRRAATDVAAGRLPGRARSLTSAQVAELIDRADAGVPKTMLAREYGVSRETVYAYLRAAATPADE
ncbi:helix-turn-helix domain-containing protein [Sphingomonas sp. LR61]|uniref:helix-turn-helix domain-containing protein n=1 Tax=Sphingomonas sp. LR61 TaxID=3050234 RepID=UPI003FA69946